MKAPWFPFYCSDFLASSDVQLMEANEVGAYVLLLVHSWQSDTAGYLPNDEGRLRRLARLSAEAWKESRELILSKWPVADNPELRFNPRLKLEAAKQVQLRELKAEAGKKSAELKAARKQESNRSPTEVQQEPNRNSTPVENKRTDDSKNGNYSQSQLQSHSSKEEGRKEGKPSNLDSLKFYSGAAHVFTRQGFKDYVKKQGFGHIDRGFYLPDIERKAELTNHRRDETGWENFVSECLKRDLQNERLVTLKNEDERPPIVPFPDDPRDLWGFNDTPEQRALRLAGKL